MVLLQRGGEAFQREVGACARADPAFEVAAGKPRRRGPAPGVDAQRGADAVGGTLGEQPEGRQLAAPDLEQRRAVGVELEREVARRGARTPARRRVQRAHAGVAPDDVGRARRFAQMGGEFAAQIVDFDVAAALVERVVVDVDLGRAQQREVVLERNREQHAAFAGLQQVGVVAGMPPRHHQVAAAYQPQRRRLLAAEHLAREAPGPRSAGVDQRTRVDTPLAPRIAQRQPPVRAAARRGDAGCARQHDAAALGGVDRAADDQPRVVGARVVVGVGVAVMRRQHVVAQRQRGAARQAGAARQRVVQRQPGRDQPARPSAMRLMGQHEALRLHQMRRGAQQALALGQRRAHQRELEMLEIAQAAVNQFGRRRRGVRAEVVALAQQHAQAASGEVAGDAGAVDAAADDGGVECRVRGELVIH
ncbi:hypothetical protein GALL_420270 [mine drainage metagenome]|uniref:Uncharacterized protein n=1 Tax=mine drainage metagenome TaxID=410659 RepID=A0A1J5PXS4_9ZZZZ